MVECKKRRNTGFSLVELSVVLLVVGLVTATSMQIYNAFAKAKPMRVTLAHQDDVKVALERFLATEKRLPCPALLTLAPDAVNAGIEDCSGAAGAVFIGAVPYATLSIELKKSYDGWHRKLQYAVTQSLTDAATYNAVGAITVKDYSTSADITTTGHVVVLSQGRSGFGAYMPDGVLFAPCGSAADGHDYKNCDNNSVFVDYKRDVPSPPGPAGRSLVAGVNHFESVVLPKFTVDVEENEWNLIPAQTLGGFRTDGAAGNVGINTRYPVERLHVDGNIRAAKVHADKFANHGGANVFEPRIIGGTGIKCSGATGTGGTMRGIQNNQEACVDDNITAGLPVPGVAGVCYPGTYVIGVSAGSVVCNPINGTCGGADWTCASGLYASPSYMSVANYAVVPCPPPAGATCSVHVSTTHTPKWMCHKINGGVSRWCPGNPITLAPGVSPPAPPPVPPPVVIVVPAAPVPVPPSAPDPVNGLCGSAQSVPDPLIVADFRTSKAPQGTLCATGTPSAVSRTSTHVWSWSCAGADGGTSASCSAHRYACNNVSDTQSASVPAGVSAHRYDYYLPAAGHLTVYTGAKRCVADAVELADLTANPYQGSLHEIPAASAPLGLMIDNTVSGTPTSFPSASCAAPGTEAVTTGGLGVSVATLSAGYYAVNMIYGLDCLAPGCSTQIIGNVCY